MKFLDLVDTGASEAVLMDAIQCIDTIQFFYGLAEVDPVGDVISGLRDLMGRGRREAVLGHFERLPQEIRERQNWEGWTIIEYANLIEQSLKGDKR